MIDPSTETLLTLKEAAAHPLMLKNGKARDVTRIYSYINVGKKGIKLEHIRTPTLCTSVEAIQRWFERLTMSYTDHQARTPSQVRKSHAIAEKELDAEGLS